MESQKIQDSSGKSYIIKSSLTFSATNIILFVVGILSIWVTGTYISSYNMGVISLLSVFYSMSDLMMLGLGVGINRYMSVHIGEGNYEDAQNIVNLAFILLGFYLIATNIIIPIIMFSVLNFFQITYDFYLILFMIISVNFYQLYWYFVMLLTAYKQYNKVAIVSFIATLAGILLSLFLIVQGYNVNGFITRWLITNLVGFILFFAITVKLKLSYRKKGKTLYSLKKIFNFSLPYFLISLLLNLISYLFVKTAIGIVLGLDTLGYYEFSFTLINIFSSIMLGFNSISLTHLSHEYGRGGIEAIEANIHWMLKISTFIIVPLLYFILIFGYPALLYFVPRYIPSVVFLNALVISNIIPLIYYSYLGVLFALGKNWRLLFANVIAYSGLFVFYFFLPYIGITAIIIGDYCLRVFYIVGILIFASKYVDVKKHYLAPIKFIIKTLPILVIGLLIGFFFPQIYVIPINAVLFVGLFVLWVRFGNLISAWEIDKGFSFLPERVRKFVKIIFIRKMASK